jgi:hypothetical protein
MPKYKNQSLVRTIEFWLACVCYYINRQCGDMVRESRLNTSKTYKLKSFILVNEV